MIFVIILILLILYLLADTKEHFNIYYDQHDDKSFRPDSTLLIDYPEVSYPDYVFHPEFEYPWWFWNSSKLWNSQIPNKHNLWNTRIKNESTLWDSAITNPRSYDDFDNNSDYWKLKYGYRYWPHFYGGYSFKDENENFHRH